MDENSNEKDNSIITAAIQNIPNIKDLTKPKNKRQSKLNLPLMFEIDPESSPIKKKLISLINDSGLTYSDLFDYCSDIHGDYDTGRRYANNIISGLRRGKSSMMDSTFSTVCDFLDLDILLVKRKKEDE